jgi:hypothetical protein
MMAVIASWLLAGSISGKSEWTGQVDSVAVVDAVSTEEYGGKDYSLPICVGSGTRIRWSIALAGLTM